MIEDKKNEIHPVKSFVKDERLARPVKLPSAPFKQGKQGFNRVKLYTTDNCSFCFTLREFLKENSVEFEEINISQDEKKQDELLERLDQKGIRGSVPILDISGELIIGFEREKICNLLNIKD